MLRQRRDRDTWDRLRALLREHKTYNRARDGAVTFQEMDKRLHLTVLRSCENRYIDAFFTVCSFLIDYQLRPEELAPQRIDLAVRQHVRILNALLKHDEANALKRLATHMRTVRRILLETVRLPG